jgi:hypothetical protein
MLCELTSQKLNNRESLRVIQVRKPSPCSQNLACNTGSTTESESLVLVLTIIRSHFRSGRNLWAAIDPSYISTTPPKLHLCKRVWERPKVTWVTLSKPITILECNRAQTRARHANDSNLHLKWRLFFPGVGTSTVALDENHKSYQNQATSWAFEFRIVCYSNVGWGHIFNKGRRERN